MIEKSLRILGSFKDNAISVLLHSIRQTICTKLLEKNFSNKAHGYFAEIDDDGQPFNDFEIEPKQVVQIKSFINALYHAEKAFIDLESLDLHHWYPQAQGIHQLYSKTIHEAYVASYLLTHLDLGLSDVFEAEITQLKSIFSLIANYAESYQEEATEFAAALTDYPLSYKSGKVTGIIVDQMQPHQGSLDYNFLAQFSAVLPGYIQMLTFMIHQYSSQICTQGHTLDTEKMEELQENAFKLSNAIDDLGDNVFFASFRTLNYINIIRQIVILATSIIEQIAYMIEASQEVIRTKLTTLKYDLLPGLFSFFDRLEDQAMLRPGVLSKPLMDQVKPFYESLIFYARIAVNFTVKGEDLLILEDAGFVDRRLKETWQRIGQAKGSLLKTERIKQAFFDFFAIIEEPQYQDTNLIHLPVDVKKTLAMHYRYLQQLMEQHNPDLNNAIIHGLTETSGFFDFLNRPFNWYNNYRNTDKIENLLLEKKTIAALFLQEIATANFHIELNADIIQHVKTSLKLHPNNLHQVFLIDERAVLQSGDKAKGQIEFLSDNPEFILVADSSNLNTSQCLMLYQYYVEKITQMDQVLIAYQGFMTLITNPDYDGMALADIAEPDKKHLLRLYLVFQPYFMRALADRKGISDFEKALIADLTSASNAGDGTSAPILIQQLRNLKHSVDDCLLTFEQFYKGQYNNYLLKAGKLYEKDIESDPLEIINEAGNRAHYLITHTSYSQGIANYRESLFQLTAAFNLSVQSRLNPQVNGLPFPELEDQFRLLAECQQTLTIKRIFNGLYHLEQALIQLESLNNKNYESTYVYHLFYVYHHLNTLHQLTKAVYQDPYLRVLAWDFIFKAQAFFDGFKEKIQPYQLPYSQVPTEKPIQYKGIWYAMQTFMLAPDHIKALDNQQPLSAKTLEDNRQKSKRLVIKLERILAKSDSYLKLLFETPTMYQLLKALKSKLLQFTAISHDAVLAHLSEINTVLLTNILLETDQWEYKLGLKPGTLSQQMKAILDRFYQGLIEPLGLDSKQHLELITDLTPLRQRQQIAYQRGSLAYKNNNVFKRRLVTLTALHQAIQHYNNLTTGLLPPLPSILGQAKKELIRRYQKAHALLCEEQTSVTIPVQSPSVYEPLDDFLNDESLGIYPKLTSIAALTNQLKCHYQGLSATCQLEIDTTEEQLNFLFKEEAKQVNLNREFVNDYMQQVFLQRVELIAASKTGLVHIHDEYREQIKAYLLTNKNEIIKQADASDDIKKTINDLLIIQTKQFENDHLKQYLHLDKVLTALVQFKGYLKFANENDQSLFESQETILKKTIKIKDLWHLALNKEYGPEERLAELNKIVVTHGTEFRRTVLAHRKFNTLSFNWLCQCLSGLLSSLNLYTPNREKRYRAVVEAVKYEPTISSLPQGYSFFTPSERSYNLPKAVVPTEPESDAMPSASVK